MTHVSADGGLAVGSFFFQARGGVGGRSDRDRVLLKAFLDRSGQVLGLRVPGLEEIFLVELADVRFERRRDDRDFGVVQVQSTVIRGHGLFRLPVFGAVKNQ